MIRWICVILGVIGGGLTVLLMIQEEEDIRKVSPTKEKPENDKDLKESSTYKGRIDSALAEINKTLK